MAITRSISKATNDLEARHARSKLTPCKYFNLGNDYCRHGETCYYSHSMDSSQIVQDHNGCAICYEQECEAYGLMEGCSHVFCLDCIRRWRHAACGSDVMCQQRRCPVCRQNSRMIIPLNYIPSPAKKEVVLALVKARYRSQPCQYFQDVLVMCTSADSSEKVFYCPFYNECLFGHEVEGRPYTFSDDAISSSKAMLEALAHEAGDSDSASDRSESDDDA